MADYLSNLINRTLGQTDALKPRPVSRFEPYQVTGEQLADQPAERMPMQNEIEPAGALPETAIARIHSAEMMQPFPESDIQKPNLPVEAPQPGSREPPRLSAEPVQLRQKSGAVSADTPIVQRQAKDRRLDTTTHQVTTHTAGVINQAKGASRQTQGEVGPQRRASPSARAPAQDTPDASIPSITKHPAISATRPTQKPADEWRGRQTGVAARDIYDKSQVSEQESDTLPTPQKRELFHLEVMEKGTPPAGADEEQSQARQSESSSMPGSIAAQVEAAEVPSLAPALRSVELLPSRLQPIATVVPALTTAPLARRGSASEPELNVQVTIGRIEVRATPPPATPARNRPQPQGMSLDDYLLQRAEGEYR